MRFPSEKELKELREHYPEGARVELVEMDDPQAPPVGTKGTVLGVDDAGDVMVAWDNGSGLNPRARCSEWMMRVMSWWHGTTGAV